MYISLYHRTPVSYYKFTKVSLDHDYLTNVLSTHSLMINKRYFTSTFILFYPEFFLENCDNWKSEKSELNVLKELSYTSITWSHYIRNTPQITALHHISLSLSLSKSVFHLYLLCKHLKCLCMSKALFQNTDNLLYESTRYITSSKFLTNHKINTQLYISAHNLIGC